MRADLQTLLFRKGLRALRDDRDACTDCGRTPLEGELVHRLARGERTVCALCAASRHRGEASATEPVRNAEWGHTVRPAVRAA